MPPRRKKPRPYIDTNVILDYIRNRNHDSVLLLETIKRKKIRCWTSWHTLLELIDREQENKWIWNGVQHGETLDDFLRHRYPRKLTEAELGAVFAEVVDRFVKPFSGTNIIFVMVPSGKSWSYY
jgi:predicted nucleic acid-binding protein